MVAAITFAIVNGKTVAGVHDHSMRQDLRIAAEFRDGRVQGFDGDRNAKFGGTLPEIFDAGDKAFISIEVDGVKVTGYDRGSSTFFAAQVNDNVVQLYDYGQNTWFTYDIQDPQSAMGYHRQAS